MREPAFWWREAGLAAGLLAPAAACYGAIAARRMAKAGARAGVPVLCVGNFTLGGAGKTPTALWLAKMLKDAGERPFCLSRGYGGSIAGPKLVDATPIAPRKSATRRCCWRAWRRRSSRTTAWPGPRPHARRGASVVVMDDGLQNPSLAKDFTLAVVDGRRGIGNGRVFPAGPLRAPLAAQLARTDALLVIGDGNPGIKTDLPVFHGRLVPDAAAVTALKTRKVLAFAGIGDPDKFFATVQAAGIAIAQHTPFPDHHRFTAEEAAGLIMQAEHGGLALLTTEKDRARMTGDPVLAALAAKAHVLPVTLVVDEEEKLRTLVLAKLRR